MTEAERRRRQAFNSGPAAGTLRIVGDPASNPGMPSGTGGMTVYQQALAAHPQQNTLYSPDRRGDLDANFRISDDTKGAWGQIAQLYQAGDAAGAQSLISSMAGKDGMTGFYNDDGTYTGMVRGYKADANGSYQPVVGGRPMWTGDPETNIWLKPDGTTFTFEGGVLQNSDTLWSRNREPVPYQPRTWTDVQDQNGLTWGDTYAIKAAHGDFTNPALNTPEGNARKLNTLYEKPLGFTDEEWAKHTGNYDPAYIAEIAKAAGGSNPSGGQYPSGNTPAGQTPYQQALNNYQPMSWEEWQAQNGVTPQNAPQNAPGAYDPNSDPLWQQYLAQYGNAQAPTYEGDPYQAQRDAALEAYGKPWEGSQYQQLRDQYLQNAANMEWKYDPNTDPVWQALQKQYRREGQRATEDTLGRYAAMTGGMPSTAAVSAAQQAGNYYAAQLSDRLPQVYQDAYNRYLQEYQRQLGISDAYAGFDDREYSRWMDQQGQNLDLADRYNQYGQQHYNRFQDTLDQWNRDRNFSYGAARDNQQLGRQQVEDQYGRYRDAVGDARYADETAYERYRDTVADQRWDAQWAQQLREYADSQNWKATEWDQYLREYGDKLSQQEREWAYQQMRDAVSDARYEDTTAYQRSLDAWQMQQEDAQLAAKYGDYSGLQGLGIDTGKADPKEVAYAPDGSTYKFNSDDALYFTQNAPNGTPGNPTTMRGSDGSIWKKDEYGGVTIEKNGKIYTYSAGQVPAQTSTGYRSSGSGSSGSGSSDLYVDELIAAGITDPDMAIQWLDRKYPKMTVQTKNAVVNSLTKALGGNEGPSSEDKTWARGIMEGVAKGQYNEDSWVAQRAKEILGIEGQTGTGSSANAGDQSAWYRNLDESLGRMVSRGASRDEIFLEIDNDIADGRITKEQGDALREKYYGQADNIANSGTHANGMPRSSRYTGTLTGVRQTLDTKGKDAALQALQRALDAGYIHDYEIDYIMDELGLD